MASTSAYCLSQREDKSLELTLPPVWVLCPPPMLPGLWSGGKGGLCLDESQNLYFVSVGPAWPYHDTVVQVALQREGEANCR